MPVRLLVVDDEKDIATVLRRGLEHAGMQVDAAHSPAQALQKFKERTYDMVLLDVRMPGMNGFALYQKMHDMKKDIKVCFLSAYDYEYCQEAKEELGLPGRCFIQKPVTFQHLVKAVKTELACTRLRQ